MITGKSSWSYTNDFPAVQLELLIILAKPNGTHAANTAHVKNISILQHNMALTVY
jgi:hypothetical protein